MPDRKKANYVLQHVRTDSHCMVDEELLESFMAEVPIIQKPVHWFAKQIIGHGFYITGTSVMKELMLCYLHVFIEIYFLIMTK